MAKRPQNHITGDSAIRKIASDLIPEEWTISIPDSDYGLDMLVEVVQDNKTTGKLFFIQSKGTTESSADGKVSYSLNIERIRDYSEIKLPVLFVYYSKSDNKFWGRWMNSLYSTLTDAQKSQSIITLHFSTANEINSDYLRGIGDNITPSISNQVSLECDNLPKQFNRFHSQLLATAKSLIGKDITTDCHLGCCSIFLSYEGALQDGSVEIKYGLDAIHISIHITSSEVLYYPPLTMNECPPCLLEVLFVVALFGSSVSSESARFALAHPQPGVFDRISFDLWLNFLHQASREDVYNLSTLFDVAIKGDHQNLAQIIVLAVFKETIRDKNCGEFYRDLISRYLASAQDGHTKGLLCYNLANSIRTIDCYEAFNLYCKAIHHEPAYKRLYYWWQEVAGVLYFTHHYYFAELFYKKARRLSPKKCLEDISMLISDCLICQGKIGESLAEESGYFDTIRQVSSVNILKSRITEMMKEQQITVFENVFWFNQGVKSSQENNHKDAMACFLFAWRLYDGDIEALVNAFWESYNIRNYVIIALVLDTLRTLSPEEGYKRIVSSLLANIDDNNPRIIEFLDSIKELFFSTKNQL